MLMVGILAESNRTDFGGTSTECCAATGDFSDLATSPVAAVCRNNLCSIAGENRKPRLRKRRDKPAWS
jgi:hypothetical protein